MTRAHRARRLLDLLAAALQFALPQRALTRTVHAAARSRVPWWKNLLIRAFTRAFGVDLTEAALGRPEAYASFNAFFTRALRPGTRSLAADADAVLSPVDGVVSAIGRLTGDTLVQAKGLNYTAGELLGEANLAGRFTGGAFATLYLSPRDYHRVHMPLDGELIRLARVPGRLFAVNPPTRRSIPRLFARNERLVCVFESAAGPMAVVLVGALLVAGIETVFDDGEAPRELPRGAELGRFNMGSTVIVLFGADRVAWAPAAVPGARVRMGEILGRLRPAGAPSATAG